MGHPDAVLRNYLEGTHGDHYAAARSLTAWRPGFREESQLTRDHLNRSLSGFAQEGFRIRDEEDRRYQQGLSFLQDQFQQTTQPTLTDQDINRMYTAEADAAAQEQDEMMRMLRGGLGGAGNIGGGTAAGIAARLRSARIGQQTKAKGNLRSFKALHDADRASQQWQQAVGLTTLMTQGPSDTGLGVLGEMTGVRLTQLGQELGRESSKEMARATRKAGELAAISGAVGGGLSAFGAFAGSL